MATNNTTLLMGAILEEEVQLTLGELSKACTVHAEYIVELVEEGIIEPVDPASRPWVFSGVSLKRVRTVQNLQGDLGVNLPGVALALELMAEVESLRASLNRLSGGA